MNCLFIGRSKHTVIYGPNVTFKQNMSPLDLLTLHMVHYNITKEGRGFGPRGLKGISNIIHFAKIPKIPKIPNIPKIPKI